MLEMEGTNQRKTGHLRSMMSMSHPALGPAWPPPGSEGNHGEMAQLATLHCDASFTSFSSLLAADTMRAGAVSVVFFPDSSNHPTPPTQKISVEGMNGWQGTQFLVLTFSNCGYSLNTSADHRPAVQPAILCPFFPVVMKS